MRSTLPLMPLPTICAIVPAGKSLCPAIPETRGRLMPGPVMCFCSIPRRVASSGVGSVPRHQFIISTTLNATGLITGFTAVTTTSGFYAATEGPVSTLVTGSGCAYGLIGVKERRTWATTYMGRCMRSPGCSDAGARLAGRRWGAGRPIHGQGVMTYLFQILGMTLLAARIARTIARASMHAGNSSIFGNRRGSGG
jgi:hypothetical protein